jgi:BRCT domain type II-containing protein
MIERFVLTGTWPNLGRGNSLELGKDKLKAIIEDSGGSVTKALFHLTNALVEEDNPGPKRVQEAHEQNIVIVDLNQLKDLIYGTRTLEDLLHRTYPAAAVAALLKSNIQVQRQSTSPNHLAQATKGTAGDTIPGQEADVKIGHSNR